MAGTIETRRAVAPPGLADSLEAIIAPAPSRPFGEAGYHIDTAAGSFEPFANVVALDIGQRELAKLSGVGQRTILRIEQNDPTVSLDSRRRLQEAFEGAGIVLFWMTACPDRACEYAGISFSRETSGSSALSLGHFPEIGRYFSSPTPFRDLPCQRRSKIRPQVADFCTAAYTVIDLGAWQNLSRRKRPAPVLVVLAKA